MICLTFFAGAKHSRSYQSSKYAEGNVFSGAGKDRATTVAQKCHGNFNLFTAISICSRQFQFAHGNFNLLTAISIYSRPFQFYSRQFQFYLRRFQSTDGNFTILLKALSIFSRQRSRHFSLRSPPVSYSRRQWPCTNVNTENQKSIFKEKSENHISKVDLRTSLN